MGTLGWILVGVGILVANGLFWILLYQREVGALIRRISRLEHRLVNLVDLQHLVVEPGDTGLVAAAVELPALRVQPDALTEAMVSTASNWTLAKSISTTIASVALLVVLCVKGIAWLKTRKAQGG